MSVCVKEREEREKDRERERRERMGEMCVVCVREREGEIERLYFRSLTLLISSGLRCCSSSPVLSLLTLTPLHSSFLTPLHSSSLLTLTFLLSTSLQHFTLNIFISTLPVVSFTNLTLFLLYSLANFSHFFHSI